MKIAVSRINILFTIISFLLPQIQIDLLLALYRHLMVIYLSSLVLFITISLSFYYLFLFFIFVFFVFTIRWPVLSSGYK